MGNPYTFPDPRRLAMSRLFGALLLGLAVAAVAHAHALYLVTDARDATKVLVVFGDELAPDETTKEATWKRFDGLKLSARDKAGKDTPVKFTRGKGHLLATVPAGTQVVFGEVEYGLFAKGKGAPKLIKYYPKAIVGAVPDDGGRLGKSAGLEIVPKAEAGKVRFQVLARGKPVAGVTVSVLLPKEKGEAEAKTDEEGWTKSFDGAGRYGVTCRKVEPKGGERDGKKYDGVSHTATLVVDVK
jgi:uncharacterized GH25 family protein